MLDITVYAGDVVEQEHCFDKLSVMIGRGAGNDICLSSQGVSRYHARISVEKQQLVVQDLDSTNGTFVNSRKVGHAILTEGDLVTIGQHCLKVCLRSPEDEVSPTSSKADTQGSPSVPFVSFSTRAHGLPQEAASGADSHELSSLDRVVVLEDVSDGKDKTSEAGDAGSEDGRDENLQDTDADSLIDVGRSERQQKFYWESLARFLQPVWEFIEDDSVSEIMINGAREIYIERKGRLARTKARFSEDQLRAAVLNIAQYVGRRISDDEPYLDARLPDGSRVAILLPPCARCGISIAIRKFGKETLTLEKLLSFGSLSREMISYLEACVILKKNIIISGGTSSGKTSLLNVVSSLIPSDERIVTIEDSAELQLVQEHVVPMETRPPDKKGRGQVTIRDLVKVSLRMRPDRIVVGEIRSGEALDLLQAMNTGHSGSMATLHANTPRQALSRLETLALFSGIEIPMLALRDQVSSAVEVVIQAARLPDHSRKVTYISEIDGLNEDGTYIVRDIFRFRRTGVVDGQVKGEHVYVGNSSAFIDEMELAGLTNILNILKTDSTDRMEKA